VEPIIPKRTWLIHDVYGNPRWCVALEDGRNMYRSRLIMMNFLHTNYIPSRIHVHHEDEVTDNDIIGNLGLIKNSDHNKIHHPRGSGRFGISPLDDKKKYAKVYNKEYQTSHRNDPHFKLKNAQRAIKRYNEKLKDDPEFKEHRNKIDRNSYHKRMQDPEYVIKRRLQKRLWGIKNKESQNAINQL